MKNMANIKNIADVNCRFFKFSTFIENLGIFYIYFCSCIQLKLFQTYAFLLYAFFLALLTIFILTLSTREFRNSYAAGAAASEAKGLIFFNHKLLLVLKLLKGPVIAQRVSSSAGKFDLFVDILSKFLNFC